MLSGSSSGSGISREDGGNTMESASHFAFDCCLATQASGDDGRETGLDEPRDDGLDGTVVDFDADLDVAVDDPPAFVGTVKSGALAITLACCQTLCNDGEGRFWKLSGLVSTEMILLARGGVDLASREMTLLARAGVDLGR